MDGQQNTAASLLQYGVVVAGSSVLATFWQEPQHGTLLLQNSHPSARIFYSPALSNGSRNATGIRWGGLRFDAAPRAGGCHLAWCLGRKMRHCPCANFFGPHATRSAHLASRSVHAWPLRAFDAPIRHEPLLHRLEKLLHEACDGAVRFGEQLCTATSACVPVPPSELQLDLSAGDEPPHGVPPPPARSCVVLRGLEGAAHVGLAWLKSDGERASAHLCVCSLDDLKPPHTRDPLISHLFGASLAVKRPSSPAVRPNSPLRSASPSGGEASPSGRRQHAGSPKTIRGGAYADRLCARFNMHLSKCIGPAAVECLFEGLHGNARPTYDDFTYCLDACDATRVLELPIDAALCHADAPLELAARMREALSIAFKPVSCVGGGGGSSTGPITSSSARRALT